MEVPAPDDQRPGKRRRWRPLFRVRLQTLLLFPLYICLGFGLYHFAGRWLGLVPAMSFPDGQISLSPDGRLAAVGRDQYSVDIVELPGGRVRRRGVPITPRAPGAFTPDGRFLLCWNERRGQQLGVYDLENDRYRELPIAPVPRPRWNYRAGMCAVSPDGRRLALHGGEAAIGIFTLSLPATADGPAAVERETLFPETNQASYLHFMDEGRLLVTAGEGGVIQLWDPGRGVECSRLELGVRIFDLACSPDGRLLAAATEDNLLRLWRVDGLGETAAPSLTECAALAGDWGWTRLAAWSPDGQTLIVVTNDTEIRRWQVERAETGIGLRPLAPAACGFDRDHSRPLAIAPVGGALFTSDWRQHLDDRRLSLWPFRSRRRWWLALGGFGLALFLLNRWRRKRPGRIIFRAPVLLGLITLILTGGALALSGGYAEDIISLAGDLINGRRHHGSNEASAIATLRTLNTAQQQYRTGEVGRKYGTLATLSGVGNPAYLDTVVGSGTKSGYHFRIWVGAAGQSYSCRAYPAEPGITGNRYFFTNSGAVIFHATDPRVDQHSSPID